MHIGFDISQTGSGKTGCGFFADAMIKTIFDLAPQHRYSLYPTFGDFYVDPLMPIRNPYHKGDYGRRYLTRELAGQFWSKPEIERLLKFPQIIHANNFWCPSQLKSARLIYTFYDMSFVFNSRWTTEANRIGCFNGVFCSSIMADWIVAISEASRRHYLEIFPHFPPERIRVIYPCSRFSNSELAGVKPKALSGISDAGFWLSVGTIEPRKNQRHLAQAYARYLALGGNHLPLVFAGGAGWLMDDFHKFLRGLGIEEHVILTGYISDEELRWLYQNCYANLYPSLFEGFGLPLLEGMQHGAPTITSFSTSMPEVTGDSGILLPPTDIEAWAQAMLNLVRNPDRRKFLSEASREQAVRFNWKQSAMQLLELYDEAIHEPKRKLPSSINDAVTSQTASIPGNSRTTFRKFK
jgi:alpha-1,3-rhamnosyl/mannosyltransferase